MRLVRPTGLVLRVIVVVFLFIATLAAILPKPAGVVAGYDHDGSKSIEAPRVW